MIRCGKTDLAGELRAVGDVADDDLCALQRLELVVRIASELVLDKMFGCCGLADIVVEGADRASKPLPPTMRQASSASCPTACEC